MTYGELKTRALLLSFDYSLAGTEIPDSYNNQSDYLAMIPGLVNSAQMDIATRHKRIPSSVLLSALTHTTTGAWDVYTLPADCWQTLNNGLLDMDSYQRFHDIRLRLDRTFYVRAGTRGDLILEYWRYPTAVTNATTDSTALDNTPDVHECLPYAVAAGLLLYDDPYRSQTLKTEYETRISKLTEPVWLDISPISNVYRGER